MSEATVRQPRTPSAAASTSSEGGPLGGGGGGLQFHLLPLEGKSAMEM